MQNSVLKLTALAGVVGIGFLAVLQAQRGLNSQVVSPPPVHSAESPTGLNDPEAFNRSGSEFTGVAESETPLPVQSPNKPLPAHAGGFTAEQSQFPATAQQKPTWAGPTHAHIAQRAETRFASAEPEDQTSFPLDEPQQFPQQLNGRSAAIDANSARPFAPTADVSPTQPANLAPRSPVVAGGLSPARPGRVRNAATETILNPRESLESGDIVLAAAAIKAPAEEASPAISEDSFGASPAAEASDDQLQSDSSVKSPATDMAPSVDVGFDPFEESTVQSESGNDRSPGSSKSEPPRRLFDGASQPEPVRAASDYDLELIDESELQPFGEEPAGSQPTVKSGPQGGTSGPQLLVQPGNSEAAESSHESVQQAVGSDDGTPKSVQPVEFFSRRDYEADPQPPEKDAATSEQAASEAATAPGFDPFASGNDPFAAEPGAPQQDAARDELPPASRPATPEAPEVLEMDAFSEENERPSQDVDSSNKVPLPSSDPFTAEAGSVESAGDGKPKNETETPVVESIPEPPLTERPQIRQSPRDREDGMETGDAPQPSAIPEAAEMLTSPAAETAPQPVPELRTPDVAEAADAASEVAADSAPERLDPTEASQLNPAFAGDFRGNGTIGHDPPDPTQRPQLTIEKLAPPNAVLGQPMVYSIFIRNVGSSAAHQVTVEDQIPKGTQLQGTIPRAELVEKRLLWRIGTLSPGEERKIQIRVVPIAEGQVGSIATVNFVSEVAAKTLIIAPRLRLEMSAPRQAKIGEPVVVNFKITNDGTGAANGVFLRDVIPERLSHPDGNDLEYEVGTLPPRESREVKLTMTAVQPGTAVNRAVITAEGGLSTEAQAEIEIVGSQFTVKRTGPSRSVVGRPAVFTNIVANDFDDTIRSAVVVETVPAGMEFVEATAGGQFQESDRTITWRIETIGPKESTELKATLIPQSTGKLTSQVTVRDALGGEAKLTSETMAIGFASLALDLKTVSGTVAVGEGVSIKLQVRNRGSIAAQNVKIKVVIPPEMQFVSAQGHNAAVAGNEIRFDAIPSIAADSNVALDLALTARKPGDARVRFAVQSEEMQLPLNHEESIVVFTAGQ